MSKKNENYEVENEYIAQYHLSRKSVRNILNSMMQMYKNDEIKETQFQAKLNQRFRQATRNKKARKSKSQKQDFIFYNSYLITYFMECKKYKWDEYRDFNTMELWKIIDCKKDKKYKQKVYFKYLQDLTQKDPKPLFNGITWQDVIYLNALYQAYKTCDGEKKRTQFTSGDACIDGVYNIIPLRSFFNILFPNKKWTETSAQVKKQVIEKINRAIFKVGSLDINFYYSGDKYCKLAGAEYFLIGGATKNENYDDAKVCLYAKKNNVFERIEKQNRLVAIPHEALTGLKNIKNYHALQMYIAWRVFTAKNKHNHMKTQINIPNMFSRYTGKVTIHVVRDYFQFLKDQNFIKDFEFNKRSSVSWTYPGNKKQAIIIIKDENKNLIEKEKTEEIKETEKDIDDVNLFTSKYTVTCGKKRIETALHAVYNNNDWSQGGRLYTGLNGHQGLSEEDRALIKINGKSTVEVDFSCYHPHLIYALEGVNYKDDAYSFWIQRSIAKKAFNIALNAKNKEQAILALKKEIRQSCAVGNAEQIFEYMQNRHQAIKQYFFSGAGVKLQNQDAKIALSILKQMKSKRICCLPIHDSFIVQTKHEQTLKQVMLNTYKEFTGYSIDLKSKTGVQA